MTMAKKEAGPLRVIFYKKVDKQLHEVQIESALRCFGKEFDWHPPQWEDAQRDKKTLPEMMKMGDLLKSEGFEVAYQEVHEWP
jgi:hypothetical protein